MMQVCNVPFQIKLSPSVNSRRTQYTVSPVTGASLGTLRTGGGVMLEHHFTAGFQQKAESQIPPWFVIQHDTRDFVPILVFVFASLKFP